MVQKSKHKRLKSRLNAETHTDGKNEIFFFKKKNNKFLLAPNSIFGHVTSNIRRVFDEDFESKSLRRSHIDLVTLSESL